LYEARWQNSAMSIHQELFSYPLWNGRDSLEGKIIILHPEQGFGDTIQFCRYARLLAKQANKVYLVVNDPLYHLMKHSVAQWPDGQNIEILTAGAQIPAFHFHLPLMTAPGILGTDLSNIPNFGPYLYAENTIAQSWQQRLGEKRRPRVGLVWSGSDKHTNDKNRSIPLSELLAQFQKNLRCSLEFHSLQKEIKSEDLPLLEQLDIRQHTLELKTFSDTAALITQMDLVISVDTSVAHLAAALGVTTWIALPHVPDFRWLLDRQDSPWYSSMRLFRQTRPREWTDVLVALAQACNQRFSQTAELANESHTSLGQMNLANELVQLGKWNQAESMYRNEFESSCDSAKLQNNWGVVLQKLRRFDEALHCFDRAIQLDPNYVSPRLNKSMCLLSIGQFDEGWELYEWRWKNTQWDSSKRHFSQPLWSGQKLEYGSTLLIYAEQGLGDTLQFCRLLSLVLERLQAEGVSVIFEVPASLVSLLRCLPIPVFARSAAFEAMPAFDYQCPLLSVPLALKLQVEDIPQQVPYLKVDSDKEQQWAKTIPSSERLKIGVVWAGSGLHQNDKNRSISFGHFSPLLQLDADYYVLQKELTVVEKTGLEMMRSFGKRIQLLASKLEDFTDTAAAINNLDLIISVDTSVAHLAGALGKPLYLLLPYEADFRWMHERSDTAWYPSAHLFRQRLPGDWKTVIQAVRTQLIKEI
jgi:ADP-heptose:LPS heptosyltransferase